MRTDADYKWIYKNNIAFNSLLGKVITRIEVIDDRVEFYTKDNERFTLINFESWCGNDVEVWPDDDEDYNIILDSPILLAEETEDSNDAYFYSFYKLSTNNDSITMRFCGRSNGYYSEKMQLYRS